MGLFKIKDQLNLAASKVHDAMMDIEDTLDDIPDSEINLKADAEKALDLLDSARKYLMGTEI